MKKIIFILTIIFIAIFSANGNNKSSKPTVGNGSFSNPYQISHVAELFWFAEQVNNGEVSLYAKLIADIYMQDPGIQVIDKNGNLINYGNGLTTWNPIGWSKAYKGGFDGNGHIINGLYVSGYNASFVAQMERGGSVKNLGVVNSYFGGSGKLGAICGFMYDGQIRNCYNAGTINGSGLSAGGICGETALGSISWCYNTGKISIENERGAIGGICGKIVNGSVGACYNTGDIVAKGNNVEAGGICGSNGGNVGICYNIGSIKANSNYAAGGISGYNGNNANMNNCYNFGKVTNKGKIGGICGRNWNGKIQDCFYLDGTATTGIGENNTSWIYASRKEAQEIAEIMNKDTLFSKWTSYAIYSNMRIILPTLNMEASPIVNLGITTDNKNTNLDEARVYIQDDGLYIYTSECKNINIIRIDGIVWYSGMNSGLRCYSNLTTGIYVIHIEKNTIKVRMP